jgi:hypothetical protein
MHAVNPLREFDAIARAERGLSFGYLMFELVAEGLPGLAASRRWRSPSRYIKTDGTSLPSSGDFVDSERKG